MTPSFTQVVALLQQPPSEPCESELKFLTPAEYEAAFNEAEQRCRHKIIRFIAHLTSDYTNAEDLAQEVFTNLYRARVSFDNAYIYGAARNIAYNHLRQTRRRHILESRWAGVRRYGDRGKRGKFDLADARPLPDRELFERARAEAVKSVVERLPEKFRVPILLRLEGKSYRQVIDLTQANVGTVKSRICRGKRILRRNLRAYL
jgi:RNA polymerase sigma-70 factor (ECF subfamily)